MTIYAHNSRLQPVKRGGVWIVRAVVFIFILILIRSAYADERKNVLILNSYHQGYKWTDDETLGAVAGLRASKENVKIYIEYMGTKWTFDQNYFRQLIKLYKLKFGTTRFDVIITTDDDAFNFIARCRDEIFGTTPVVFCGTNWIQPEKLAGLKSFTGVNEDADIAANIDCMLKLHPRTRDMYVIVDSTTTGISVAKRLNTIIPLYSGKVNIHFFYNEEMDMMLKKLSELDKNSLVLLTVFQQDKTGRFFEYDESCRLITDHCRVPVYGLWDFNLGSGIVGGKLVSGYSQGITAGTLALRVLKGEPAESIPVIMDSPNRYMFDYVQMKRFEIDERSLPDDRSIINKNASFYSINKRVFWAVLMCFLGFAGITGVLILNNRRRFLAEKALRFSIEKYHALVDNLNVGVFRCSGNKDDPFISVNPAMIVIFGYDSYDDFIRLPVFTLYSEPSIRESFINDLLSNGSVQNREMVMKKKDGTLIWVSVNAALIYDEYGKGIYFIDGIVEDITEKKRLEMELRHSQKMETIGTLASGIAHDFNNVLGGLIGVLSLIDIKLQSGLSISPDKLKHYIAIMTESSEKGVAMVKRLLTIAKKKNSECISADLRVIVKHVLDLLISSIDKSVVVHPEFPDGKILIHADPVQIEQALLNICVNAGHAMTIMKSGRDLWGGTLTLSIKKTEIDEKFYELHREAAGKEYWDISISDTGVGMPAEIISKIFDPFFTTKGEGLGTGLGLAMVKSIIRDHHGFIDVTSAPGKGTVFNIYLPVSPAALPVLTRGDVSTLPAGTGLILVVDDESFMREAAREILQECGYKVITAENGAAAVEIFKKISGDVRAVVMDMAMPVMSGIVAYKEMQKINSGVKVLIASGFSQDKRVIEIQSIGNVAFIEKPYTLETLGTAVKAVIENT